MTTVPNVQPGAVSGFGDEEFTPAEADMPSTLKGAYDDDGGSVFDSKAQTELEGTLSPPSGESGAVAEASITNLDGSAASSGLAGDGDSTTAVAESGPPAKSALKAEWVAYAQSQGASEDDANAMTVAQLQDKYGR